ncbi:MAG: hypothetical protein BJG00_016455 [Limnothrix sp. CACIAM 69d]|nr:MAG: hypothetical protein BJG00_016455 [Limnothrix sp. CACIAM 69d]
MESAKISADFHSAFIFDDPILSLMLQMVWGIAVQEFRRAKNRINGSRAMANWPFRSDRCGQFRHSGELGEFAEWVRYGWGDRALPNLPKPDGGDRSNGPTAPQWCEGDNRTC